MKMTEFFITDINLQLIWISREDKITTCVDNGQFALYLIFYYFIQARGVNSRPKK